MQSELFDVTTDDGVRLQGERWPGNPGAPVVLGLHGLSATRKGFLSVIDELAGEVDFVSFDARGRGLSDKPEDVARYGHRRNGDDAAAVLRALSAGPVVVVGQSMGTWVGTQLAAHHPDLVRSLVLVDGGYFRDLAPGEDPAEFVASVMGLGWSDRLRMTVPSAAMIFGVYQTLPAFQGWWSPQVEEVLGAGLEELPDGGGVRSRCYVEGVEYDAVDYFRPFGETPYVKADLAKVKVPATLIRAEFGFDISPDTHEPLMPLDVVEQFQADLPQLEVITVPGTNHYSVNFGPAGAQVIAEVVRKSLA